MRRTFEFFVDSEDDNVFAIETGPDGNWLPAEEGTKGPRVFKILSNASLKPLSWETASRWKRRAWRVSKEEALRKAGAL